MTVGRNMYMMTVVCVYDDSWVKYVYDDSCMCI